MKQVILIHGLPDRAEVLEGNWPSPSNMHWFPWIQRELTRKDILCQALEMPVSYNPVYVDHERVFQQMEISDESVLVGHSCGAGFLLKYLSLHPSVRPRALILVAPWLDPEGYLNTLRPDNDFLLFELDPELTGRMQVHCIFSRDDDEEILVSVERIRQTLPFCTFEAYDDKGHFCESDLKSKEFPELFEKICEFVKNENLVK